jgi:hypothetical protein
MVSLEIKKDSCQKIAKNNDLSKQKRIRRRLQLAMILRVARGRCCGSQRKFIRRFDLCLSDLVFGDNMDNRMAKVLAST